MYDFEQERIHLALRLGTRLPKPAQPKLKLPGFRLGSCHRVLFSPSGDQLVASTSSGTFLWDVAAGIRARKLKVPSNPTEFSFNFEGDQLLIRNEQGGFSRIEIPSGKVLATFSSKHKFRLDGVGAVGPGNVIGQMAHGGVLLMLDGESGEVLRHFALALNCYSGAVYWFPRLSRWVIAQTSTAGANGRCTPCAIWMWADDEPAPVRMRGAWDSLQTRPLARQDALLLHHVRDREAPAGCVIEKLQLPNEAAAEVGPCGANIIPSPTVSHDGTSWAVSRFNELEFSIRGARLNLPASTAHAHFHPSLDLVAVSGPCGFVARIEDLAAMQPLLKEWSDERELSQRGYSRMRTLPDRKLPPRVIVFANAEKLLFQSEMLDGRKFVPLVGAIQITRGDPKLEEEALAAALARSRSGGGEVEPSTATEVRPFLEARITPPTVGWISAVAVSFASDAIEVWPLKPEGEAGFTLTFYPVAALSAESSIAQVMVGVREMLGWYKPRKTGVRGPSASDPANRR